LESFATSEESSSSSITAQTGSPTDIAKVDEADAAQHQQDGVISPFKNKSSRRCDIKENDETCDTNVNESSGNSISSRKSSSDKVEESSTTTERANKDFHCTVCNIFLNSEDQLRTHREGRKHLKREATIQKKHAKRNG
jgi:hypothetical protein